MKDAYVLSLFNDPPKKARNWQRPFFAWTFGGVPLPLSEDAMRQNEMLRADTYPTAALAALLKGDQ